MSIIFVGLRLSLHEEMNIIILKTEYITEIKSLQYTMEIRRHYSEY